MKKIRMLLAVAGVGMAALLSAVPASAAPADATGAVPAASAVTTPRATQASDSCWLEVAEWNSGLLNAIDCEAWAWAEWRSDGSRPELFAIAANRTVWHVWPGGGGWQLIPGNKSADDIINGTLPDGRRAWWWSGSTRNISIWVSGGTGYWCTSDSGRGWSGTWRDC
ncbi:hypothetical protein ABGB07_31950 [Micromonosporaceae bacterium B7E4]